MTKQLKNKANPPASIALATQKGGVGKTATAINLAHALVYDKHAARVLLIDADPQANATTTAGTLAPGEYSVHLGHLITENATRLSDVISPSKMAKVDIIPNYITSKGMVRALSPSSPLQFVALQKKCMAEPDVFNRYDYVIMDCPPDMSGAFLANMMCMADFYITPVEAESTYALDGVDQFFESVNEYSVINPNLRLLRVLITMWTKTVISKQVVNETVRVFGKDHVFSTIISRATSIARAISEGKSAMMFDTRLVGSIGYRALAEEVVSEIKAARRDHA